MKAIYVKEKRLLFIPSDRRNPDIKGLLPFSNSLWFNILNVFFAFHGSAQSMTLE